MGNDMDEASVVEQVAAILKERGLTVSVAEACTSGLIASKLTSVSGSSRYFIGGVLAYANEVKEGVLGVPKGVMVMEGSVSPVTAREMAKGARCLIGTNLAIAATGVMGPTGGTRTKPVGLFFVAVAGDDIDVCVERRFSGDRGANRESASDAAIELLRDVLLGNGLESEIPVRA